MSILNIDVYIVYRYLYIYSKPKKQIATFVEKYTLFVEKGYPSFFFGELNLTCGNFVDTWRYMSL